MCFIVSDCIICPYFSTYYFGIQEAREALRSNLTFGKSEFDPFVAAAAEAMAETSSPSSTVEASVTIMITWL